MTGASPVVDTQATKISTSFDSKKLATLPNGSNDPWAMLAETPAVKVSRIDVGGSASGTQVGFTAYGTGGQRPYYEGINGTENTSGSGNYVDMNAYDEVAVNTVGNNAEMGPPGVMMVFVVKSGGNAYHGSGGVNYTDSKWQSYNIDAAQVAASVQGGGGLEPRDTTSRFARGSGGTTGTTRTTPRPRATKIRAAASVGTAARSGPLLRGNVGLRGAEARAGVERSGATPRRQLQRDGRRQDRRQSELGPVLGQPGHRVEKQSTGTLNTNQPYEAFNVATTIKDPGPDGKAGTADDGASIAASNLAVAYVGLPTVSFVTNVRGESAYNTIELAMNNRLSSHWSASASYSLTWSHAYRTASNTYPDNPNSCINANAKCQDDATDYSFKLNGTFELPAGLKVSPVYRFQAGNNFARTFVASGLNYANPTINAESLNAGRNDNINLFDLRIDRGIAIPGGRLSPFLDLYNLSNTNPIQDITVTSGTSFLRPINILPPRVMRIGVKFEW